jgi:hypothetical protein
MGVHARVKIGISNGRGGAGQAAANSTPLLQELPPQGEVYITPSYHDMKFDPGKFQGRIPTQRLSWRKPLEDKLS